MPLQFSNVFQLNFIYDLSHATKIILSGPTTLLTWISSGPFST